MRICIQPAEKLKIKSRYAVQKKKQGQPATRSWKTAARALFFFVFRAEIGLFVSKQKWSHFRSFFSFF